MTDPFNHLSKGARESLALPPDDRIQWFKKDHWIQHDAAKEITTRIDRMLKEPKIQRMPCALIVGESNNGKTALLERVESQNPPTRSAEGLIVPAIKVDAPPVPDELRLFNAILSRLGVPFNPNDRVNRREPQTYGVLAHVQLRVLMIDEIHNLLAGPLTKQQAFLNALKRLTNTLRISIVAAGTRDAGRALAVDPQMANRFEPSRLAQWQLGQSWQQLIVSFERLMPLPEPSHLGSAEHAAVLYTLSEGWIGELKKLLAILFESAIRAGKPRIDEDLLRTVRFVPPSKRRMEAGKERM